VFGHRAGELSLSAFPVSAALTLRAGAVLALAVGAGTLAIGALALALGAAATRSGRRSAFPVSAALTLRAGAVLALAVGAGTLAVGALALALGAAAGSRRSGFSGSIIRDGGIRRHQGTHRENRQQQEGGHDRVFHVHRMSPYSRYIAKQVS